MAFRNLAVISSLTAFALLAGCTSSSTKSALDTSTPSASSPLENPNVAKTSTGQAVVVQGACPQVYLRDGTAVYRQYAKGVKKGPDGIADQDKLVFQANLDNTTRQCFQTEDGKLRVTVVVHGRLVPGPAGSAGSYTLPIRVAATDGDNTLYSELTKFTVTVPPDLSAGQFVFTKENVILENGPNGLTRIFAGIDEGPYKGK